MSIEVGFDAEIDLTGDGEEGGTKKEKDKRADDRLSQQVYQYRLTPNLIPLVSGSGTLLEPTQYGPPVGFMWSVRRLTISGYTAGTVTVYLNQIEPIAFPAAGTYTFGKGELMLDNGDNLSFTAASVTGQPVVFGSVDVIPRNQLPAYLGVGAREQ